MGERPSSKRTPAAIKPASVTKNRPMITAENNSNDLRLLIQRWSVAKSPPESKVGVFFPVSCSFPQRIEKTRMHFG
jgi:hypothetical protein